jgi:hypothetical protein
VVRLPNGQVENVCSNQPCQPLVWDSRFLRLERGKRGSVSAVGFVVSRMQKLAPEWAQGMQSFAAS